MFETSSDSFSDAMYCVDNEMFTVVTVLRLGTLF